MNTSSAASGLEERAAPRPHRRGGGLLRAWFDPRGRGPEAWAFAINRACGLALVLYLYLHLAVLSLLLFGGAAWNGFLDVAGAWPFLGLDVILITGLLFHAANGVRIALIGSGQALGRQRGLLVAAVTVTTLGAGYAAVHVLGGG